MRVLVMRLQENSVGKYRMALLWFPGTGFLSQEFRVGLDSWCSFRSLEAGF